MLIVWSTRPKLVPLLTSLSNTWFAPVFFIHDCTTPISQELLQPSITKMGLKITCPKLYSNLPGTNEFISCHAILGTWHIAGGCCGRHRLSYCRTPTGRFRGGRCGEGRGFASHIWGHTKPRVIMMPILSSLVAAEVALWQPTVPVVTTQLASRRLLIFSDIMVTLHEHHGTSNHRRLDYMTNSLIRLTK